MKTAKEHGDNIANLVLPRDPAPVRTAHQSQVVVATAAASVGVGLRVVGAVVAGGARLLIAVDRQNFNPVALDRGGADGESERGGSLSARRCNHKRIYRPHITTEPDA